MILRALAFLLIVTPLHAADLGWNPAKTQVLVVGTLEWKDAESFEPFPAEDRRDKQLVDFFRKAGVPAGQVVYLSDRQATMSAIDQAFGKLLAGSDGIDTLIVYYCGHGYEGDNSEVLLAPYDAGTGSVTGWSVADLGEAIQSNFQGRRVLLLADCCHSGSLVDVAKTLSDDFDAAALASSTSSELSTGNWTFTESVLSALRGEPWADVNGDGRVTFTDMQQLAKSEMAFAEEQVSVGWSTPAWKSTVLAKARRASDPKIGAHAMVLSDGERYKARIIDAKDGEFLVWYYGYDAVDAEWVAEDRINWVK